MLSFGIIGTSDISHKFIQATKLSQAYQLSAVYSRTQQKAKDFCQTYGEIPIYTEMDAFFSSPIDLVYIASPNSLHFEQARKALLAGKHTIVEKPMITHPDQLAELARIAKEKKVFLFEAARNYHEAAFATIRAFLADKTILGGHFTYAKYSSKMEQLLKGENPNIFSADFAGGALMDLGVYTLYAAIGLIGRPNDASYTATQLPNTIDLNGVGQLFYDDFYITVQAGKNISSNLPSEIYTTDGTLTLSSCEYIQTAQFQDHDGHIVQIPLQPAEQNMLEEALAFAKVITQKDQQVAEKWLADAASVHQTIYTMRQSAKIHFKGDY